MRPYVPELKVALLDLGTQDARALARDFPGPPHVRLALSFLRSAVEPKARLAPTIAAAATEVRHLLARPGGAAWWRLLLRYTVLARPGLDVRAVEAELRRHAGTQAGEVMKSTYEELIEQGERRGLRKGREEGRAGLLSLQLEARFGKLSAVIARRVRDASTAELERWAKRVLTAKRIEDVIPPQRARKR